MLIYKISSFNDFVFNYLFALTLNLICLFLIAINSIMSCQCFHIFLSFLSAHNLMFFAPFKTFLCERLFITTINPWAISVFLMLLLIPPNSFRFSITIFLYCAFFIVVGSDIYVTYYLSMLKYVIIMLFSFCLISIFTFYDFRSSAYPCFDFSLIFSQFLLLLFFTFLIFFRTFVRFSNKSVSFVHQLYAVGTESGF